MKTLRTAVVLGATALLASSASAYNYDECRGDKRVWDDDNKTFKPSTVSFPSGSGWRNAIESARSAWNYYTPASKFDFYFTYTSSSSYSVGDGTNSVLVTSGYSWNGALGVARTRYKSCVWPFWGGKIDEVDVLFNPSYSWTHDTTPDPLVVHNGRGSTGTYSSTLVALHEFGHAMGLKHENDQLATMNDTYPNGGPLGHSNDVHPHGDDVLGARAGYGTSGSPRDLAASLFEPVTTNPGFSELIQPFTRTVLRQEPTTYQFTFENRGTVNETSVGVKFYLSTDRTISTSDILLGSAGFSINQGTSVTRSVTLTVPSSVAAGDYYFGWMVDPEGYIPEVDEGNNWVASVARTRVIVGNVAPTACFTANPTYGSAPLSVTFNAGCSSDPDGTISSYTWTLGDGSTRTGQSFTYTYFDDGFFNATLTVRDNGNRTDSTSRSINVLCSGGSFCECVEMTPEESVASGNKVPICPL